MPKKKWDGFGKYQKIHTKPCDCCGEKGGRLYNVSVCECCWMKLVEKERY